MTQELEELYEKLEYAGFPMPKDDSSTGIQIDNPMRLSALDPRKATLVGHRVFPSPEEIIKEMGVIFNSVVNLPETKRNDGFTWRANALPIDPYGPTIEVWGKSNLEALSGLYLALRKDNLIPPSDLFKETPIY